MDNQLIPHQQQMPERRQAIFDLSPKHMVTYATEVANVLKDVIDKQGLAIKIGPGKPYVKAEGWATLGVMLGILPREREVKEHANGDFEASVDLIRQADGVVVGGASSLCSTDEKRWAAADRYARRSMAVTRATGKAYRLCFAWIMTLAGYNPTPAEEMPHDEERPASKRDDSHKQAGYNPDNRKHSDWLIEQLNEKGIADDRWDEIGNALRGRPSQDLTSVLESFNL